MAVSVHVWPSVSLNGLKKTLNASTDTLQVLLIASGTYTWNGTTQAHTHVSDFLSGLTEVSTSGTGYTRQTLTSVTLTDSGLNTTLDAADPSWASATFSAVYACFYDNTVGGTDSTNQLICYWDFGSAQSVSSTNFSLNLNVSGLCQWQHS